MPSAFARIRTSFSCTSICKNSCQCFCVVSCQCQLPVGTGLSPIFAFDSGSPSLWQLASALNQEGDSLPRATGNGH
jgi:hypothetical protein